MMGAFLASFCTIVNLAMANQMHCSPCSWEMWAGSVLLYYLTSLVPTSSAWMCVRYGGGRCVFLHLPAVSSEYLENDLVAVQKPDGLSSPRLCVVRPGNTLAPLCQHEDDVETDLYLDPRCDNDLFWGEADDQTITETYGEGWYGQRPVPSLGGGPGYGAEAQEIWSIDEKVLERLEEDGVELPVLDVGMAHGEKARAGSFL